MKPSTLSLPWVRLGILIALLGGGALACEYPGVAHPLAAQAGGGKPLAAAREAPAKPKEAPPQTSGNPEGEVPVGLKDFFLDPDRLSVKAGKAAFSLKNLGRFTHDFRVEGQGIDERAPKVGVGHSLRWEITLKPGEYQISCPISNHADRGMVGVLTVLP